MNPPSPDTDAFTGLEAAIVLIAFIIVAAVFGYVVLGSGFLTTQKAQETVHAGVSQATSGVQPVGAFSVKADGTGMGVSNVTFYLQLSAAGTGVDMQAFAYTVSTSKQTQTYTSSDVIYNWVKEVPGGGSNHGYHTGFLAPKEMVLVDIDTTGFSSANMGMSDKILVEAKPSNGAPVPLSGTIPAAMNGNSWYDIY